MPELGIRHQPIVLIDLLKFAKEKAKLHSGKTVSAMKQGGKKKNTKQSFYAAISDRYIKYTVSEKTKPRTRRGFMA
ncbi:hypothetical protein [Marinobacter sp.]|uniref:hypothetical protein n=1 Tax=Marinobacter sp. TaxID=50741 RepID=UPI0035668940